MKRIALAGLMIIMCLCTHAQSIAEPIKPDSLTSNTKSDSAVTAQDVIIFRSGDEIVCKVIQFDSKEVYYKSLVSDMIYSCQKNKVLMIKYSNGTQNIFMLEKDENAEAMFHKGTLDARVYYQGDHSGAGCTFATTFLLGPLLGLIPAAACCSSPPKVKNFARPKSILFSTAPLNNVNYVKGYQQQALKMKRRDIWRSYGYGVLADLALILIASAIVSH